jgi:hypothetical protein
MVIMSDLKDYAITRPVHAQPSDKTLIITLVVDFSLEPIQSVSWFHFSRFTLTFFLNGLPIFSLLVVGSGSLGVMPSSFISVGQGFG